MKKYILFISLIVTQINLYSQYPMVNPAPLKPGNYWVYSFFDGSGIGSYTILDSNIFIDSTSYILVERKDQYENDIIYYRLDTNNYYITYNWDLFSTLEVKYYKKNAQLNDSWTNTFSGPPNHIAYYKIIDTSTVNFYGIATKLKTLEITDSGLVYQLQYWSDDFGLLSVTDWEGASGYLHGCVINGKVYGDTIFTGIIQNNNSIPKKYYLSQNYPNPFNPSTVIQYQLASSEMVTLKVFDILGREVKILVNDYKSAGNYSITFDASRLASGIYFYQLRAGNFISTKKMLLMK